MLYSNGSIFTSSKIELLGPSSKHSEFIIVVLKGAFWLAWKNTKAILQSSQIQIQRSDVWDRLNLNVIWLRNLINACISLLGLPSQSISGWSCSPAASEAMGSHSRCLPHLFSVHAYPWGSFVCPNSFFLPGHRYPWVRTHPASFILTSESLGRHYFCYFQMQSSAELGGWGLPGRTGSEGGSRCSSCTEAAFLPTLWRMQHLLSCDSWE